VANQDVLGVVKMKERFKTPSSVFGMVFRNSGDKREILLQLRQSTGYMDGYWDASSSGHVEENEFVMDAVVRETKEEIGITVEKKDVEFAAFTYCLFEHATYCYIYFDIKNYSGEPKIAEPEKCADLKWFGLEKLPENMISDRKETIQNYMKGIRFGEFGRN
jgi:8-oxo-dGTP pyrophosphatase MutT (NUDIX family)